MRASHNLHVNRKKPVGGFAAAHHGCKPASHVLFHRVDETADVASFDRGPVGQRGQCDTGERIAPQSWRKPNVPAPRIILTERPRGSSTLGLSSSPPTRHVP